VHYSVLNNFGLTKSQALVDSLVSNMLLAGCCILISHNMRYYLPRKERYMYVLVLSLALSIVWLVSIRIILWFWFRDEVAYQQLLVQSSTIRFGLAFLLTGCMSTMSLLWYTLLESREAEERKSAAEKSAKDAELYKLRQQLQPHFLFNSLNSINALIGSQPEQARKMILQLSDFLRGTLKKEEHQWIAFTEELQYLELYLDIEKVRFGHRLSTSFEIGESVNELKIPPMLLQPVMENAIKFGLYDTMEDITIRLEAKAESNNLVITIQNPFDPTTANPRQGTGFGLSSVQRRLYLLFARNDLLETDQDNHTFKTTVKIPQPA